MSVTTSSSLVAMPARPLPPRVLRAEGVERGALDVACQGHGHDHVLALDQVLVLDAVGGRRDARLVRGVANSVSTASNSSRMTS